MSDPLVILEIVVGCLGFLSVGLLSLAEAALVAASEAHLTRRAELGDRRAAAVLDLREGHGDFLAAILVGINCCVIVVATAATLLELRFLRRPGGSHAAETIVHLAVLGLLLLLAELTPKLFALRRPEAVAIAVVRPVHVLTGILQHLVRLLRVIAVGLIRLAGGRPGQPGHFVTEDEIRHAADVAEEEGSVEPEEREMIEHVIELGTTTAREVMIPRVDIVALPTTATVDEAVTAVEQRGLSRLPLYDGDIDNIVGILYVTDLLAHLADGYRDLDLADLARPPVFVPESKKLDDLFDEMRAAQVHLAIVLDEYGATEGLVSLEDILEEIVGEIQDEHDVPLQDIVVVSPTEAIVGARTPIDEVNERLDTYLPEGEYDTLAGFVLEQAGMIPEPGQEVRWHNIRIVVLERKGPALGRLKVLRDAPAEILLCREEEIIARANLTVGQLQTVLARELDRPAEQTLAAVLAAEAEGPLERGTEVLWDDLVLTVLEAEDGEAKKVRIVPGRG